MQYTCPMLMLLLFTACYLFILCLTYRQTPYDITHHGKVWHGDRWVKDEPFDYSWAKE